MTIGARSGGMILVLAGAASLAGLSLPLSAQQPEPAQDPYARAIAAGYKAAFLCSGLFVAGRSEAQVEADELTGAVPDIQPLLPALKADIDRKARIVSVRFDDRLPPRIAAWRPHLGCAQLPIGTGREGVAALPRLPVSLKAPNLDARPWPMGDAGALAVPRRNAAAIEKVVADAFDSTIYGARSRTTAVILVQDGKIVAERYRSDIGMHVPQRTWSAAKSIASTLVGVGARQGRIKVDAPAHIRAWKAPGDPRARITTDQLLRMASGLYLPTNNTMAVYFGGSSLDEQVIGMPMDAAPGTRFRYSNNDSMLAARSLAEALGGGERALAFPFTDLFWKIGMTRTYAETDWKGNFILSSQVWTTARDMARLGLLYVNDGVWEGTRILPAEWAGYVRRHGRAQPSNGNGYGAAFWTSPPSFGFPKDAMYMGGNRGQFVVMVPSRKLVIVRRGVDVSGPGGFDPDQFTKAVLAAI